MLARRIRQLAEKAGDNEYSYKLHEATSEMQKTKTDKKLYLRVACSL